MIPRVLYAILVAALTAYCRTVPSRAPDLIREDSFVPGSDGVQLFVREVRLVRKVRRALPASPECPVLLVHGGGPGGLASFDLPVPGYSLAADLARGGHSVYVMDIRGWGRSTRPAVLEEPPEKNSPAVSLEEAARDIGAVVDWIRSRSSGARVALIGWATGGHWCGAFTSRRGDAVSGLVMINSLYGVAAPWPLGEGCRSADRSGAFRLADRRALLSRWDSIIPVERKELWREDTVAEAYVREALDSDPTSGSRNPPSLRIPLGYFQESCRLVAGEKLWNGSLIRVPTLVVRGERDFWSRPADLEGLRNDLVNAPTVRTVTIPEATHHLFLDRPDRGRRALLEELLAFLRSGVPRVVPSPVRRPAI